MEFDNLSKRLGEIVISYSLDIQADDVLLVQSEKEFAEFAKYIAKLAQDKGATIIFDYRNPEQIKKMVEKNDREELAAESARICNLAEQSSARVLIDAETNPNYLKDVNPRKVADYESLVCKPFLDRICGNKKEFKGIKWNLVAYPCEAEAKKAGMSLSEYASLLYSSTNIDWKNARQRMEKIKEIFDGAKEIRVIVEPFTDICLSLKGRGGNICDGKFNLPDGEVYYGPVEDSADGRIYFPYVSTKQGNEVKGITLKYEGGKVIEFSAKENQGFLKEMLNLPGVKKIGEFGIGANPGIKKYTNKLLFDEKIDGTIHLAIGNSYKEPLSEGGGLNEAEIHWDLVCDLRKVGNLPGGEIYVDGKLVQKNGRWVFD